MYCLLLILSALPLLVPVSAVVLPTGDGPYRTQMYTQNIIDQSRADPYASDGRKRSLMLSIISPISSNAKCHNVNTRYMPDLTAAFFDQLYAPSASNGTFESIDLSTCSPAHEETVPHGDRCGPTSLPILIFSPGLRTSRLLYTALCQSIASQGVHVVAVDHPYDALVVEYPDGSYVPAANITTNEQIEQDISVRVRDIQFVVDSLRAGTILPRRQADSSHSQIFMLGHSLGGATALSVMLEDPRIIAGANMDGIFFLDALPDDQEVTRPFLLIGNQRRNASTDLTWDVVRRKYLSGQILEFQLLGTEHPSFTDLPLLVKVTKADNSPLSLQGLDSRVGSVDGLEISRLITAIALTFFRGVAIENMAESPWTGSG